MRPARVVGCILVCISGLVIVWNLSSDHKPATHMIDLFDDHDRPLTCPSSIRFDITNRRHLAIIISANLPGFVWENFCSLLCAGVDAYVMLDEVYLSNASSRSPRSYTHRFLYISNAQLESFGVSYMKKLPSVQYTAWDRVVVWLYQREKFTDAWIVEHDVQWFHVRNMTYLFDLFVNDRTDLLCNNIVPTNSSWMHWPQAPSDIFPRAYWTGTFSPLVRWSERLLQHHYRYMRLIHKDRLRYEFDRDYRFQEFIMGTIARTENLSIATYGQTQGFMHIALGNMDDRAILGHLRHGRYILHPVKQESILTNYETEELNRMIVMNDLQSANMSLLKKKIKKQ